MGLFQKAVETYDAMQELVGVKEAERDEILAPVGYMTATAKIEITVDAEGNFIRAKAIDEKIPIPCTEKSSGRSSAPAAHPLCDNLGYVTEFDEKKHNVYLAEVKAWKESEYGNSKLDAIYAYLVKNSVLKDCRNAGVIEVDKRGKIKEEKAIVTWRVEGLDKNSGAVHEDLQLMRNFSKYYLSKSRADDGICIVTGKREKLAVQHLKGVSIYNGNAKIISSNDTSNYTYRGRFINSDEAMTMGYVSSQKAHNALKWLLSNFGVSIGNRQMLCWNPQGRKIPKFNLPLIPKTDNTKVLPSDYKNQLKAVVNGYKSKLPETATVVIASFDAATSGRLSVTYYNELQNSDFLDRLYYWDTTCCWYDNRWGVQSPVLYDIVKYAFGTQRDKGKFECDSNILGQQLQRLISCRLDKALFPKDIMKNLVNKASNLQIYTPQNINNLLFVACAVVKKCRYDFLKEEWKMALDENIIDRSYQFGRLLAVLEKIEKDTYKKGEERETNAIRAQAFFVRRPLTASGQIMSNLKTSYYPKLSVGVRTYYEKLIGEIMEKISLSEEGEVNKALTETYLLGYYLQKNSLYTKKETGSEEEE